jgi:transcriptional regulator with XRE-family HTH domain
MSEKSQLINKLKSSKKSRASYVRSLVSVNIASQTRALRRRQNMTQKKLADEAEMLQPRISVIERPGESQYTLETLIRLAAAFKVGLIVRFAPLSEMLRWENEFSQDTFDVATIEEDVEFQREEEEQPAIAPIALSVQKVLSEAVSVLPLTQGSGIGEKTIAVQPFVLIPTGSLGNFPWFRTDRLKSLGEEGEHTERLRRLTKQTPAHALKPTNPSALGSQTIPIRAHS